MAMGVKAMAITTLAAKKLIDVAKRIHVTAWTLTEVPTLLKTNRATRLVNPHLLHMQTISAGPSNIGRLG
jgi:hypothetical protein